MTEIFHNAQMFIQTYLTKIKKEDTVSKDDKVQNEEAVNSTDTKTAIIYEAIAPKRPVSFDQSENFYGKENGVFSNETMEEILNRIAYFPCNVSEEGIITKFDDFVGKNDEKYTVYVKSVKIENSNPAEFKWILNTKLDVAEKE